MSMALYEWDPIPLPEDRRPQHAEWMRVLKAAWEEGPEVWSAFALCRRAGCRLLLPSAGARWILQPSPLGVGLWDAMVKDLLLPLRERVYGVLARCGRGEA